MEQRCHELSQQLKIAKLAVKELESSQEVSTEAERQVAELRDQLGVKEDKIAALEVVSYKLEKNGWGKCHFVCVCVHLGMSREQCSVDWQAIHH